MPGPHRPETRPSSCYSRAPACSLCANAQPPAGPAARSGLTPSEPVCLALFTLRMGVGGGAQSCACGGCRWVTHPHRSLLHQFWWGKAPLIGFVENGLPPWRSGRDAAHGLTGGTVSWRVPYAGVNARSGRLPPQPSLRSPASTPCRPPGRRSNGCFALESVAAAAPCWQRWASCAHSDQHRAAASF